MNFDYVANNTFAKVHTDPNKFIFVKGCVGSGKSSGCIWHLFLNALNQTPNQFGVRHTKYGVIRSTYPVLKTTVVRSWLDWFKNQIKIVYDTPIRGLIELPLPDGTFVKMELSFIALDREEEVIKLQSLELTGCHINEAAEIPRGIHQMLKSRINRFPHPNDGGATKPFILCDYNSVDTQHWLYKIAEEEKPEKHSFYSQPPAVIMCDESEGVVQDTAGNWYRVNPYADNLGHWVGDKWIKHLDEDYYADMILGADPDWVNVMVMNNYGQVRSGRPVYAEYQDATHCAGKPLKPLMGVPLIIGMDLGLTPAAAFCQLSPEGTFLLLDEITTEDCSIQKFCEDLLWPKIRNEYSNLDFHLVIDPAAVNRSQNDAKAAYEVIKEAGLPFRTAKTNNPMARREAVVKFLRKVNGFTLSPICKDSRKGFISEYKFEKIRSAQSEMFKEKPEKNIFSHIHDAIQYAALEIGGGRIHRKRSTRTHQTHTTPATSAGY